VPKSPARAAIPAQNHRQGPSISVVYRAVDELRLDPKNPRKHSRRQIKQIARSIEGFGFNVPVLVDTDLKVIAGHGRLLACRELGWTEVPTISLEHLDEQQARAFAIADNRLTENSEWDDALLGEHLAALAALDLEFDLEATGFEMAEIDMRIEALSIASNDDRDAADELPAAGPPVTRPGELWVLGEHRILCANALEPVSYDQLLDSNRAAVVFTDPPYNVPIDGHVSGLGAIKHREFAMASGEMSPQEFTAFLGSICSQLARSSTDGALVFVCMDFRHMGELMAAGEQARLELKNLCIWVKDNAGMGSLYRSQHELVFVFKNGKAPHRNNVKLGRFGRSRTNVWRYAGVNSFSRGKGGENLLALHPTVKPVALVADAILDCSARGDIVLDAFLGSGTTVLAAERTGRRGFGLELDPIYVDVAVRRWEALTGKSAVLEGDGRSFREIAEERASEYAA
jgi:DNA modification methylase